MATLRNKRKLAAVLRNTQESATRNGQSQNTFTPGMTGEYITQVSAEIEGRVTKKLSGIYWDRLRILGALSKFDQILLNPQVRTCSGTVPGTSRNNNSKNQEPTGDRSLSDPYPEVEFSVRQASNSADSDREETSHTYATNLAKTGNSAWSSVSDEYFLSSRRQPWFGGL